jgi:pSer/pThr/pTyr-binding forkhead associated (FHA) protein
MTFDESPVERTMSIDAAGSDEATPGRLSVADQSAIDALGADHALLIVHHGPNQGARFLLDVDSTTAGRSVNSDIFLDDVTVSRQHVVFERNGTTFSIRDAGSLNGTYVNHQAVTDAVLADGDEVQIGKYRLTFHAGHSAS